MNFAKICRACTAEFGEGYEGIYLFGGSTNILDLFTKCTALKINQTDNLPAYICDGCNSNIEKFYEFRIKCENSDLYFRQELLKWRVSAAAVKNDHSQIDEFDGETIIANVENFVALGGKPSNELATSLDEFECDMCGQMFYEKHTLEGHLRNHCGMKAFQCELCGYGFVKRDYLLIHKQEHHRNECMEEISDEQLTDLRGKRTSKIVGGGSRFSCIHCGKKYKKQESLDGHIREHQGLDPFECKLCGTTFQKLRSLVLHNDAKHNEDFQKIPCDYDGCDKTFTTKFGLKEHISNIHLGIKKNRTQSQISYVCELCGKFFKNKTSLKKHSYFHTGERPFACTYCPKRFTVKDKLKNHIMRHENIKNFECSYCGMRKVTMAELKIHMNSHTMDKVYPCPQCPAVFSRDGNAKRHFRIVHRGYKPYKCPTCAQSFSKKETLKHHEMTHSGEKPHACNICEKRFIQPIALKKHLKVHSKQASRLAASTQFSGIASAM